MQCMCRAQHADDVLHRSCVAARLGAHRRCLPARLHHVIAYGAVSRHRPVWWASSARRGSSSLRGCVGSLQGCTCCHPCVQCTGRAALFTDLPDVLHLRREQAALPDHWVPAVHVEHAQHDEQHVLADVALGCVWTGAGWVPAHGHLVHCTAQLLELHPGLNRPGQQLATSSSLLSSPLPVAPSTSNSSAAGEVTSVRRARLLRRNRRCPDPAG